MTHSGTLPSEWSALPEGLYVGLSYSSGITGTIPASFNNSKGAYYDLFATRVGGCWPRGLNGFFETIQSFLPNGTAVFQDLTQNPCGPSG
jgi:hypothetical protein